MLINRANLQTIDRSFNALFAQGVANVGNANDYLQVATSVPSSTLVEEYGWLGNIPRIREWIGERVVQNISQANYTIRNRDFELTVAVDRNAIEDDRVGIYSPMVTNMGRAVASFPNELVFPLLTRGFSEVCYDGQFFFDVDHPVINADGSMGVARNTDTVAGSGQPWFLIDTAQAVKPVIYQSRKPFSLVPRINLNDDNVFFNKEFIWGTDGRCNVGFGFWQFAYGSRQPLTAGRYAEARQVLMDMRGDHGRPLGIRPNLLVVGGTNEGAARKILLNENAANGETNEWRGTASLLVTPWIAAS